ncbi:putative protein S-acyltransferase 9 [Hibiscus syriacus]|uniref:S-acyltransferase n=1 Tax=Hibiscus syriacus TaxID=106335 RepID=A0A6A3B4T4_HIBSY|nr:putative protein S-acyltransferase 9 [Hibiscus syriacus]
MYRAPFPAQFSDSHRRIIDHNPTPVRAYQVWKGSNKFFLGGRVIFGPDVRSIFLTISLIVIPVVLFCAFVSRRIISAFDNHLGDLIVAVLILLTIYDLILLLLTSGRDPGIIPRNSHPPEPEEDYSSISTDWLGSQSSSGVPNLPPSKDVVVNGMIVKVKYCQTCMLYRPPRCSHCSICNNCVERFDHHCPWVGQCIGKTTYENFRYRYDSKRNPYNRGCIRNIFEVFLSKIPESKSNFREKVKVDSYSLLGSSLSFRPMTADRPKRSFDIEMGKRQTVVAEDFEEIFNRIDSVGVLERCGTEPRHTMHSDKSDWDMSPELSVLAADFAMEYNFNDRKSIKKATEIGFT